jgi:hypothetical protein
MKAAMRLAVLTLLLSGAAWADSAATAYAPQFLNDIMQARNYAMGGAYHSLGYGTESLSGNPATMSLFKRYQVELGGAWDIPNGFGFGGLSVVDSATSAVAMGTSYQLATFDSPQGRNVANLTTLGIAYPITDWLHVGVSARNQIITGPWNTNSITMNAGVALKLFDLIILGLTGNNLIDVASPLVQRFFTFSIAGTIGMFTPTFEMSADFNTTTPKFRYAGGAEYILADYVPLRAGFVYDGIAGGAKYLSFGSGFFYQGSGVDIAYRHEFGGNNGNLIALTIKLQSQGQSQ